MSTTLDPAGRTDGRHDVERNETSTEMLWQKSLCGDRDAFQRLVTPHLDELFTAAYRDIRYHSAAGDLREDDLAPEELVGETLLRAWRDRHRRPSSLETRPWLLGLQFRVLTRIVRQEQLLKRLLSVSLEAPTPPAPVYDDDESFWEWFQPDEMLRWEDAIPSDTSAELPAELFEQDVAGLSPLARQVAVFRYFHHLTVGEIASGLGLSANRVSQFWREARSLLLRIEKKEAT